MLTSLVLSEPDQVSVLIAFEDDGQSLDELLINPCRPPAACMMVLVKLLQTLSDTPVMALPTHVTEGNEGSVRLLKLTLLSIAVIFLIFL